VVVQLPKRKEIKMAKCMKRVTDYEYYKMMSELYPDRQAYCTNEEHFQALSEVHAIKVDVGKALTGLELATGFLKAPAEKRFTREMALVNTMYHLTRAKHWLDGTYHHVGK
jgi:hypothetical protein